MLFYFTKIRIICTRLPNKVFILVLYFLVSFCFTLQFSSCSDDPVSVPFTIAPARYDWTFDTLSAAVDGIYAQDTNNVFFADNWGNLIYYDGTTYHFNSCGNLAPESIGGYDKYNVYMGVYDQAMFLPKILKWNGSAFTEIIITDTTSRYAEIKSIYVHTPNEVWFGTRNGRVYKYDGSSFTSFYFDSLMYIKPFLRDENNDLYFVGMINYIDPPPTDSSREFIYKYVNNSWQKVYDKSWHNASDTGFSCLTNFGNTFIGADRFGIYRFTGNYFSKIFQAPSFFSLALVAGNSISNIMCFGQNGEAVFYNWNSISWSKELILKEHPNSLLEVQGQFYTNTFEPWRSIITRGKPKKGG